jgi:uncharacterized membrane protein
MYNNKSAILKFVISLILLIFTFFVLFFKWPAYNGYTKHFNIVFSSLLFPILLIYFNIRVSELRNILSTKIFKERRKKLILFVFVITWTLISTLGIIGDYELYPNINWSRKVIAGLVFGIIMVIAIYVFEYISEKMNNK